MLTVRDVLGIAAVRRGEPRVVAGAGGLDAAVRWVHAIELPDAARLLRGGELVLTTGIALPDEGPLLDGYVSALATLGVSALAVELGHKYTGGLPASFVAAAEQRGLPLIVFAREVPFVEITEAVHVQIIDSQLEQLRAAARLHEVFTDLAVAGASMAEIIRQAALLAGRPVIVADLAHHVLACEPAGADPAGLLAGFEARSRAVSPPGRTGYDEPAGWLVSRAGAPGSDWGRVILACGDPPTATDIVLVERTATALALSQLLARQQQSLERQAHATLISAILAQPGTGPDEAAIRARALGFPVTGRRLISVAIRFTDSGPGLPAQARVLAAADAMADACRQERVPVLAGALPEGGAAALLSLGPAADAGQLLTAVCGRVRHRLLGQRPGTGPGGTGPAGTGGLVIGVGSEVGSMPEVRRSLLEAQQVAEAAAQAPPAGGSAPFVRLADLRLRGLLHLLGSDARLAMFVQRELGPLLAHDAAHGSDLTGVLAEYLAAAGNKAGTAARTHLARPTLYGRLRHIERILGVSLDSAESRTSLHVAMLAREAGLVDHAGLASDGLASEQRGYSGEV